MRRPRRAVRRATPLERLGDPGEIARAVRFFVESGFATGAILTPDVLVSN